MRTARQWLHWVAPGASILGSGTLTVTGSFLFIPGSYRTANCPVRRQPADTASAGTITIITIFTSLVAVRDDATINFTNLTLPANLPTPPYPNTNQLSIRWLGQVLTTVAGNYTFTTTSDDGQRLWVNGTNLVDNWMSQGPAAKRRHHFARGECTL